MRRILGCFIFLMMMTSQIFAGTVYYVDATDGNDSNNGTSPSTPWRTISKVKSSEFSPGDSILFKCGELWHERLIVPSDGTSGNPITFGNYGSGANPIISGSDNVTGLSGDWIYEGSNVWSRSLITECKNVVFDSTRFGTKDFKPDSHYEWDWSNYRLYIYSEGDPTNYYSSIEAATRSTCIGMKKDYTVIDGIDCKYADGNAINISSGSSPQIKNLTASYNGEVGIRIVTPTGTFLVDNCTTEYNGNSGIQIYNNTAASGTISNCNVGYNGQKGNWGINIIISDSTNLTIEGNTIHNNPYFTGIGGDGFSNCIIQNNEIYDNYAHGIDLSADSGYDCSNNIVRYNLIHGNGIGFGGNRSGILLYTHEIAGYDTSYNEIYYNVIYANNRGISITDNAHDNNVYNNILYNNGRGIVISYKSDPSYFPRNNNIKNNIVYSVPGVLIWTNHVDATNTLDYNCYYPDANNCFRWDGTYYSSLAAYQSASGQDANSINSDPSFVNASGHDYHLQSGSPCIDAGTDVGLTEDYAGHTVPYGWVVDIGAYEYVGDNLPLSVNINASPTSGEVPLIVNFTGSATGGVLPYSYSWDFGDGTSSSEQIPTHTYSQSGDYTITLTVTDSQSSHDNDSVIINARAATTSLAASCTGSPTSGEVPLAINFTGSATGGVPPYSYSWDFGDSTSSSAQNPFHTYSQARDYTVTFTVTDSESNQDNDSEIISASAATNSAYLSCSPTSLYFGATTSGNETTDQYLRIINAGSGVLTWNIEDDADWLSCSPSSGTDRGEITVSVNASGLSLGRYTATITVSSPQAYNSPQYVSVNFRIYEPEQESSPVGSLDTPVDGSTRSGSISITGRALDDDEIGARYFFIDNVETGSAHLGSFGLRSIYREDAEERLRVGIKEVRRGYRLQADDDREINIKSILKIQIEEMEPLRIVLEERSKGNIKYIGWGENEWKALPIGSTLDREKGIFLWIPTPGFIGRYVLHFAVTDGSYRSKPLRVILNVIPKSYD